MPWSPEPPFNDIPTLPPQEELETKSILKACIPAHAALSGLARASELSPHQGLLINLLPLMEAKDSSEIENIVTTMDRLFQFADSPERADPATKEALRYRTAVREGLERLQQRPLSTNLAVELCSTIKNTRMDIRQVPGTALGNETTGQLIYTPPDNEQRLHNLLANWENYLNNDDGTDPLIKMAVAHYQFEAIHPFTDGNGRSGRILNLLYLIDQGLLPTPALYYSQYILARKEAYYRLLMGVTQDGDWQSWVLFMIQGIEETAKQTIAKIDAVQTLIEQTRQYIQYQLPKIYSHELVQTLFSQPYCRIQNLVDAGIAKRQTAAVYLNELTRIGVLEKRSEGRDNLFLNPRLISVMLTPDNTYSPFQ